MSPLRKLVLSPLLVCFGIAALCFGSAIAMAQAPGDLGKLDLPTLRQRAGAGDLGAAQQLGWDYAHGLGVARDYAQAASWYKKAADAGASFSQDELGFLYQKGLGVPQDYAQAITLYRKAAEQGRASAQTNLGYMYEKGLGVEPDSAEARSWYEKAAAQGNQAAKNALARLEPPPPAPAPIPVATAPEAPPEALPPARAADSPPRTPVRARARVLSRQDVVTLLHDLEPKRVATLVILRGVNFALDPAAEKQLRAAGADDQLLVAIATHKRP